MLVGIKNVRLAFSDALFEPKRIATDDTSEPAYSCNFLFDPVVNAADIEAVRSAMNAEAAIKWKDPAVLKAAIAVIKSKDRMCLHDGDLKGQYEGFPGNLYMNARSDKPPKVVDRDRTPLTARDGRPYSGCYVNAFVEVWAQDNKWGKGVNATLKGVQFLRDGEAFGAGAPLDPDAFDDISDAGQTNGSFDDLMGDVGASESSSSPAKDIGF